MLSIPEKNETIYQVILNAIKKDSDYRLLVEFGYYKYQIFPELNEKGDTKKIIMAFKANDFKNIYNYSGKKFLENEFKNYEIEENLVFQKEKYDIGIKANVEKYIKLKEKKKKNKEEKKNLTEEEKKKKKEEDKPLNEELKKFALETAEKFSTFRIKIYSSVLNQMFLDVQKGEKIPTFELFLNSTNKLFILPSSDRIQLIYGIDFSQSTDISLAKIFLQELEEAKRHVKNCIDAKCYAENDNVPNSIINIAKPKDYSNNLVVFDLYVKDYEQIKKKFSYFITFREYIQFHIHSVKTFLHIKMNKKGKELEQKLNTCKIVPDEYLKNLETINFYTNWNKQEENIKLFNKESKKLNNI